MLRHIIGFVVGVVLAPALAYAMGRAVSTTTEALARGFAVTDQAALAFGALLVSGAVVGVLASARWLSPLAALVAGIAYLAVSATFLLSPGNVVSLHPPGGIVNLMGQGVLAMLGGVLVVSALSPHRWRGKDKKVAPDPSYLQPPPMPQSVGGQGWASAYAPPGGFTGPADPRQP